MKLRRARTQRHLSLADAARATKIRSSQLAELENDDYSNFANLAYARGFLVSYGKYLHLDTRPYMDAFSDASTFGMDDYQYLSEKPIAEYRAPTRPWRRRRRGSVRQVLALAGGVVVLAVSVFSFYLYVNYKRLGGLGTFSERQESTQVAAPLGGKTVDREVSAPAMVPVSSSPAPSASVAPVAPDKASPTREENRNATAALASSTAAIAPHDENDIPTAPAVSSDKLLTQVSLPATALTQPAPKATAPAPARNDPPKPQKVSNNGRQ